MAKISNCPDDEFALGLLPAVDGRKGGVGFAGGGATIAGAGGAGGGVGVGVLRFGRGVLDLMPTVELGRGAQASSSKPLTVDFLVGAGATACGEDMLSGLLIWGDEVRAGVMAVALMAGKSAIEDDDFGSRVGRPLLWLLRAPLGPAAKRFGAGLEFCRRPPDPVS